MKKKKKKKKPAGILSGIIPNLIHILTIWKKKASTLVSGLK